MGGWFRKNRRAVLFSAATVFFLAAMAGLTVAMWPWVKGLSTPQGQEKLRQWVGSLGFAGWIAMVGLQILQVVVAVIPGEPIEIIAGVLYGAWGGFLTCELGVLAGSAVVFWAVRKLGAPLVEAVFGKGKLQSYTFLQNIARLELITFILFFIPGTPKDVLTYAAGLTSIRMARFISIAMFARIPSILSSTWGGSSFAEGNIWKTISIFAVVGLASLLGLFIQKKVMRRFRRKDTDV